MAVELDTQPLTTFSKVDVNAVLKEVEEDEAAAKQPVESGMPGMPGMGGMGGMGGFDPAMMGMGGMDGMPDFSSMPGMDLPGLTGNPVGLPDAPDEAALVDELDTEIDVSGGKGLVTKRILVRGSGWERPAKGDEVAMTYIGRIPSTDVEFDRNTDESNPFTFPLGMGRVIKGWDAAVATMKKGEEAVLTIQPEYGYGASGAGEKIPPNSVLEFKVKLISWRNVNALDKDGKVILKKLRENNDHWATPRDGWDVIVKYSGRLSSSETPFDQSDSFLFTLPKTGPVAEEPSLPPFFQTAAKKLKKTEIGQLMIAKELLQGKSFLNLPADLADDVIYEVEMLKWHEVDTMEKGKVVKKILDEGSDWAKPKDNYKCQLVARGFSRPSNTAFLTLGTKEEPYQLVLGDASVPEALEVGVESMKKAERCEVTASIEYGYGSPAKNAAHGIPEGDTELFFEVELLDFQKTKESYDMNYDEKLADATRLKEQGSDLLRDGCPRQASKKFDLALRYFAYDKDLSAEQKEAVNKIRLPSLLNMAMLSAKAGDWYTTFENAQKAVDIDPKSIKALYRKAQGLYYNRKDYQATIDVLKKAIELDTDKKFAADLNGLLRVATEQRKKEVAKEKALYQGIFARMAAKKSKEPEPKEDKAEAQPMDVDGREGSAEPTEAAAGSS